MTTCPPHWPSRPRPLPLILEAADVGGPLRILKFELPRSDLMPNEGRILSEHQTQAGPGIATSLQEEDHWEEAVNEVRVARYRDLIQTQRYRRSTTDLAERILDQDLELFPLSHRWFLER
jgi:hypothetical protein